MVNGMVLCGRVERAGSQAGDNSRPGFSSLTYFPATHLGPA